MAGDSRVSIRTVLHRSAPDAVPFTPTPISTISYLARGFPFPLGALHPLSMPYSECLTQVKPHPALPILLLLLVKPLAVAWTTGLSTASDGVFRWMTCK